MYTRSEIYTTSNFLSFFRLLMAVPFWILTGMLYEPSIRPIVAGMALFAAFTDVLDGYFARRYNQVTEIGKIIDPLADKIALGAVVIRLFMINEIPDYFFYMRCFDISWWYFSIKKNRKSIAIEYAWENYCNCSWTCYTNDFIRYR